MRSALTVVRPAPETPAEAAQRVQAEAKAMADDAYADALDAIDRAVQACRDIQPLEGIAKGARQEAEGLIREVTARVMHMVTHKPRPS